MPSRQTDKYMRRRNLAARGDCRPTNRKSHPHQSPLLSNSAANVHSVHKSLQIKHNHTPQITFKNYSALPFLAVSISSSVQRELSFISKVTVKKKRKKDKTKKKRTTELEKAGGSGGVDSCHKVS